MAQRMLTNRQTKKGWRAGLALLDLLIYISLAAIFIGVLFFVLKPAASNAIDASSLKNEFTAIQSGLNQYYSDTHKYPASGWDWNTNNAYVPGDIINKGWQYQCNSNQEIITTPSINNPKTMVKLYNNLNKVVKDENPNASVAQSGSRLVVTIPDKICEEAVEAR